MEVGNAVKQVLLIEDNPGDVRLTEEALRLDGGEIVLNVVMDGVDAIKYLEREGSYHHSAKPDLILLDLNLPKKDGREVLQSIRSNSDYDETPVVVLTTSSAEQDIYRCYELKANCYVNKPLDFDLFFGLIQHVKDFWLTNDRYRVASY